MVGSWLTKALLRGGAFVVGLIRDADAQSELFRSRTIEEIATVNGRLEEFTTVERAISEHAVNVVFHLGAQTIVPTAHRSPLLTFESNVRGTYHVLEACRVHRDLVQGIVIASTDKVYGNSDEPSEEQMPLRSDHPYEVSKMCLELIAKSYVQTYGLPLALTRCGNIYGGGDLNWSRIVPGTIRSLLLGEQPIIRSNGRLIRDYLYIEDAVSAYMTLAEQLHRPEIKGEAFNFSAESPLNVLELVALIQRLMQCTHIEPVILNQADGELTVQSLSARRARQMLGWNPKWSLEDGLSDTIAWYRAFVTTGVRSRS